MNPAYSLEQPRKRMREKGREGEKGWRRGGRKGEGLGGEKEGGREEEAKNNDWLHKGKVNTIWNTE